MSRSEAVSRHGATPLAVEDAGDDAIGMMDGQAADNLDGFFIGSSRRRIGAWQGDLQVGDVPALPANGQASPVFGPFDDNGHILQQGAEQLLAIAIRGGRRRPHAPQVAAECKQALALAVIQMARLLSLTPLHLGFGVGKFAQPLFPLRLQATRHQPIVGIDGVVSAFGLGCFVTPPLDLQAPLRQSRVTIGFQLFGGGQRGFHAGGLQGGQEGVGDRRIDLATTNVEAVLTASRNDALARTMVARADIPATIMDA